VSVSGTNPGEGAQHRAAEHRCSKSTIAILVKSLKVQQCLARRGSVIAELTIDGHDIMEAEPLLLELKIEVDAPLERSRAEHESSAPLMEPRKHARALGSRSPRDRRSPPKIGEQRCG
jgi:hypothetical protein